MQAQEERAGVSMALLEGGRDDSYEALYRRSFPALVSLCTRLTGDRALGEDLAQEALLRAFSHREELDLDRAWPWLRTVATRLAVDHARRRGREVLVEEEPTGYAVSDATEDVSDPFVAEILSTLPHRQRVAVGLHYLADWAPAEAAAYLGLEGGAFKQLLFRARRRLRAEFQRVTTEAATLALGPVIVLRQIRDALSGVWRTLVSPFRRRGPRSLRVRRSSPKHSLLVRLGVSIAVVPAALGQVSATPAPLAVSARPIAVDLSGRPSADARAAGQSAAGFDSVGSRSPSGLDAACANLARRLGTAGLPNGPALGSVSSVAATTSELRLGHLARALNTLDGPAKGGRTCGILLAALRGSGATGSAAGSTPLLSALVGSFRGDFAVPSQSLGRPLVSPGSSAVAVLSALLAGGKRLDSGELQAQVDPRDVVLTQVDSGKSAQDESGKDGDADGVSQDSGKEGS